MMKYLSTEFDKMMKCLSTEFDFEGFKIIVLYDPFDDLWIFTLRDETTELKGTAGSLLYKAIHLFHRVVEND